MLAQVDRERDSYRQSCCTTRVRLRDALDGKGHGRFWSAVARIRYQRVDRDVALIHAEEADRGSIHATSERLVEAWLDPDILPEWTSPRPRRQRNESTTYKANEANGDRCTWTAGRSTQVLTRTNGWAADPAGADGDENFGRTYRSRSPRRSKGKACLTERSEVRRLRPGDRPIRHRPFPGLSEERMTEDMATKVRVEQDLRQTGRRAQGGHPLHLNKGLGQST